MAGESEREEITKIMGRMSRAWLEGRIDDLAPMIHPEVIMVLPGFSGRIHGRENFLAGFRDFSQNAVVHEYREEDHQVDLAGDTVVVGFRYEMSYERSGGRYHATGRDLWVFQKDGAAWLAVWRTMLDVEQHAV
ncbi:MAG: nuclear transport factor 2 family protein [Candidatus Eisenbacteria sp.]|nr:nuclear transport factor 2 family protein [Candidatus Eisenbacteria bacterium]